jgi:hypothetical protein
VVGGADAVDERGDFAGRELEFLSERDEHFLGA